MTSSFRFKASRASLSAREIAALRRVCPHSIAEIRRRASSHESLLDVPVFSGDWPANEARVMSLVGEIEVSALPLEICSVHLQDGAQEEEESLTLEGARRRLEFLREIAIEQDMHAQLEEGHIASPGEYTPLPEHKA